MFERTWRNAYLVMGANLLVGVLIGVLICITSIDLPYYSGLRYGLLTLSLILGVCLFDIFFADPQDVRKRGVK